MQRQRRLPHGKLAAAGFTIIELLSVCAISAILITMSSFALECFYITQLNLFVSNLNTTVQSARTLALTRHRPVVICPSADHQFCADNWDNAAIVFIDENSNEMQDPDEPSVALIDLSKQVGSLKWVAFGGKKNLTFTASGFTDNQNGRFYICPTKVETKFLRQLIIHKSGRPRVASPAELKMKNC